MYRDINLSYKNRLRKKSIILGFFMIIASNVFCFNMSNTIFDERIDKQIGYKEITFKNDSQENIRYKIKVIKPNKNSNDMSKMVQVSPKVLNIRPLGEKVLKIFAKAPNGTKEGEYAFRLQIEPIVIPTIKKRKEGVIGGGISIPFVPVVEMYGYVGDANFKKNIKFENVKLKKSGGKYILTGILINDSFAGKNIGFSFIGSNNFIVGGKWIGRAPAKFKKELKLKLDNKFKEISIYDAETNKEIKRVVVP